MQETHLSHKHIHTLAQIFQHPATHNLEWHDVISLMEHIGTVEEKDNGHLTFTRNGVSQDFHRPQGKDVSDVQMVLDLRHYLESVGVGRRGINPTKATGTEETLRLLVVVSPQETRIFRAEEKDAVLESIEPYDPNGLMQHLNQTRDADAETQLPESLTYYKEVTETLAGADEVLLMGQGTGADEAIMHLKDFLEVSHPEIAGKIVGTLTMEGEAITEGDVLQAARAFSTAAG